ncbi:MAG: non-canonical purine NTP pyrophosphatase [Ferroplasma sp.]|uniref:non-canonical purine NTP pyrophosphatase n=1 Tax=Ferroplasma sp. TaxID=2591003 RepID=UPI00281670B2|nr:non-canonical purine NTP pyrophosphatase [Ferroplasma sp.]WMT51396.1 MAG: non-canonical purine NTP pyrophosphatase [Ferroplasma sp.]
MVLKFVTSNEHKYIEVSAAFQKNGISLSWQKKKYEEIQAGDTETISRDSCIKLAKDTEQPFFIDDTGLYIEKLNGFPGPYASYVQDTIGNSGIIKLASGSSAYFKTVISLIIENKVYQFTGTLNGKISDKESMGNKFGYDPIFIPDGYSISLADLSPYEKNGISHRGKALGNLINFLILNHIM